MKIAFVANHFPVLSETFILNQVEGLLELGHEVTVHAEPGEGGGAGDVGDVGHGATEHVERRVTIRHAQQPGEAHRPGVAARGGVEDRGRDARPHLPPIAAGNQLRVAQAVLRTPAPSAAGPTT